MNVPVRMPRIAAPGIAMRVESVAVRPGSAVRAGDPLLKLRIGNLLATLHAEVIGVVKDIRAQPGVEVQADRIIFWIESPDLPPIKAVTVAGQPASETAFRLPPELLASYPPVLRNREVWMGPVSFEWPLDGAVAPSVPPVMPVPRVDKQIPELTLSQFQNTSHRLREKVVAMAELVSSAGLSNSADLLREQAERLAHPRFSIAVVGEFKRGKSSFLNALAGGEFLPNDVVPCTAFACRFQYAEQLQLALVGSDGVETLSPLKSRAEIGAELDRLTRDPNTKLREAIIRLPLPLCRDGVDLIDTPGLNDSEAMNRVTLSVLPNVDAAVLLLIPESPLSETERRFLQDHLLGSDVGRVVFVLNAKDRLDPAKLPRLVQYLQTQIDRLLSDRDTVSAPLHPVSSLQELHNPGGADTGFVELRRQLSLLLFRQRGRLILSQAMQRTNRAASEALASIKLHLAQLATSTESFEASVNEVARQLATTRLHANEIRRRLGDAQAQANSAVMAQASFLSLALFGLRESLSRSLTADILNSRNADEIKVELSSLVQKEAGKLYQQTLTKLMEKLVTIYAPISRTIHDFEDEAESAFSALAGNIYKTAVGAPALLSRSFAKIPGFDQVDMSGGFDIHVDLSLTSLSWLLIVETGRDLLARAGLADTLEARALAQLREDFGREIERQVRAKADERLLTARFLEIARRPFDSLLQSFNHEMKVLLDDTHSTLGSLQAAAAGQGSEQVQQWNSVHERIETLLSECEGVVFGSPAGSHGLLALDGVEQGVDVAAAEAAGAVALDKLHE